MKVARIKFTEVQVKMLMTGQTVTINLPDAQLQLTMDRTQAELKEAADKFSKVGKNGYEGYDFSDFGSMFGDFFKPKSKG